MAIAGKVAITLSTENGGAWSADVTYDRLVAVKHNNNLYISRKTVANVEPPNDEYWFLALQGFGGDDVQALIDRLNEFGDLIQAIISGTTQVGNAKTLDGKGLDYFFPKSGGTIKGDVTVEKESGQVTFSFKNGNREMVIVVTESGTCGVLDQTNKVWLWNSELNGTTKFYGTASGNLPLTADASMATRTIGRSSNNPLMLKNTNSGNNQSVLGFQTADNGTLGRLGFYGVDVPTFVKGDSSAYYTLIHTGNKPTGSYTGNGSAEQRTINTGGIGDVCFVWAIGKGATLLHYTGGMQGTNNVSQAYFRGGNIYIETANEAFNASGVTYYYQVL